MASLFITLTVLAAQLGIAEDKLHAAAAGHLYEALMPHDSHGHMFRSEVAATPLDQIRIPRLDAESLSADDLSTFEDNGFPSDEELEAWSVRAAHGRGHDA